MRGHLPTRDKLPGLLLAGLLGVVAYFLARSLGGGPYVSDVIVAIFLGALILNTRLSRWIGLGSPTARDQDRYDRGLRYTGKSVLRLAIILMGLNIPLKIFELDHFLIVIAVLAFALPTAFLLTHFTAVRFALRREMGDLLAIGTMICGASAINALAPTIFARRRDQGLAITSVFIFTVVALLAFLPLGRAIGLPDELCGLWAGLAVNDLSGSIAVGSQFSETSGLLAAAAKSVRILLLGPLLVLFSIFRRTTRDQSEASRFEAIRQHLPFFVVGYLLLFGLRILGDRTLGDSALWSQLLLVNRTLVKLLILAVCAGIGLQLHVKTIRSAGLQATAAGATASLGMAGVSLMMLHFFATDRPLVALGGGAAALVLAFALYRLGRRQRPESEQLLVRFEAGDALSMREVVQILELHDQRDQLTAEVAERALQNLYPAIGELDPLRSAEIVKPLNYQRVVYWRSRRGGSVVGVLWGPGTRTHIHSHNYQGVGKTIEGDFVVISFDKKAEDRLTITERTQMGPGSIMRVEGASTIHAIHNHSQADALDIHYYGPVNDDWGDRFETDIELCELEPGAEVSVTTSRDRVPEVVVPDSWREAS